MTADRITDLLTAAALLAGLGLIATAILLEAKARQERRQAPEYVPEAPAVPASFRDRIAKAERRAAKQRRTHAREVHQFDQGVHRG